MIRCHKPTNTGTPCRYNAIQRGAVIKYREYLSVGKGRDVGFEQINGFEAKVAGGNGEQSISRDAYRLGSRLDWFRLMSWYAGSPFISILTSPLLHPFISHLAFCKCHACAIAVNETPTLLATASAQTACSSSISGHLQLLSDSIRMLCVLARD